MPGKGSFTFLCLFFLLSELLLFLLDLLRSSFERLLATLESATGDCKPSQMGQILGSRGIRERLMAGLNGFKPPSEAAKAQMQAVRIEKEEKELTLKLSAMLVGVQCAMMRRELGA